MGKGQQAGVWDHLTLRPDRGTVRGHAGDSNKLDKKKYLFSGLRFPINQSALVQALVYKHRRREKASVFSETVHDTLVQ